MIRWMTLLAAMLCVPASAAPPAKGKATVEVSMAPDSAIAEVALDRPVTRFAFAPAEVVRKEDFELLTEGLALDGNAVVGAKPFRAFRLRIRPMQQERDAKYPAHFRIGSGGVVYAPALAGDPAAWTTRFRFRTGAGEVRSPAAGDVSDGFVFIGPRGLVTEDEAAVTIADPATPGWLVERSRAAIAAAVVEFTEAMGLPLPRKPVLIVRHQPGERNFNVGDVTPGAVTSLRFHGAAWEKPDERAGKQIQSFLLHEAFHFWNGGLASVAEGTPAWLHEGGAEYASLLAGLKGGVLDEAEVRRRLSEALQRCRQGLQLTGDKALAEMGFLSSQVRYPCGLVLQWSADLHMRRTSGGRRTAMDAWAETIRRARARPGGTYSLADFYAAAGIGVPEAFGPVGLLVHRGGPGRWDELPAALAALGADVAQIPSAANRRFTLIFHLLGENCRAVAEGTNLGFYTDETSVKLDSPKGCGELAGNPVLRSIEGGDPLVLSEETYAAVQRRCAASEPVTLVTADGRTLSAACATPLPAAPADYDVRRWRPAP